ncbi:Sensor histidine kinase AruS [Trametes pubescens]|uniref:histidine kinase n=1 Tax=Trametes pubescens TaxID=154538 RepID=A0A1M2VB21_TRAPU|nr:Sensor histidine kinase AruS [Trametes pubescens]
MHNTDGRLHANGLRSDLILPQIPALHPDGLSRSLADANPHAVLLPSPLPSIPRHPPKPSPRKPARRPSTASSAEDKCIILPPVQAMGDASPSACSPLSDTSSYGGRAWSTSSRGHHSSVSAPVDEGALREMNKRATAAVAGLRAEASRLSGLGMCPVSFSPPRPGPLTASAAVSVSVHQDVLPSPFDPPPLDEQFSPGGTSSPRDTNMVEPDYDWATFIHAYAIGRWDPLKTPHPPRSHLQAPSLPRANTLDTSVAVMTTEVLYESPKLDDVPDWRPAETPFEPPPPPHMHIPLREQRPTPVPENIENVRASLNINSPTLPNPPAFKITASLPVTPAGTTDSPSTSRKSAKALQIPLNISHRMRNSFADMRTSTLHGQTIAEYPRGPHIPPADATATAAAMRLAAARLSVAPLALPSPEHELTDPMRGFTATIPGSHPHEMFPRVDTPLLSPNTIRKTRLSSFWQGTQDVEEAPGHLGSPLATIQASPPDSIAGGEAQEAPAAPLLLATREDQKPDANARQTAASPATVQTASPRPVPNGVPPPATAPVRRRSDEPLEEDYFGVVELPSSAQALSGSDQQSSSSQGVSRALTDISRQSSAPPFDSDPMTVPALPRRICLARQTSAPLPAAAPLYERRLRAARPAGESAANHLAGRAAKEEQMFLELGYLAPPNPPTELERRRALYKYNIWNTGRDPNFDRIAHLVKLVFNTRIVVITLIDGNEQFFKSDSGFDGQNIVRTSSLCAHSILRQDDEPMVVLDAHEDWRFAKNPLVIGHPHVRFYAGCPLRTHDGHNIGTLALMDDAPRREFSPRQRHTLKEFAQIAMRELELWKDKIQIRIRDRIQSSMEQFTRECLEVDKQADEETPETKLVGPTSMEEIYVLAARLVKRTLDVEDAIIMDVSHVDVLETVGAESSTSLTMHYADPALESTGRSLHTEEYRKLAEFFAKHPEGKICEGVVHPSLRPFLPARIQYVLAVPIYNIDKRPFALLCAYSTGERTTPFLEGHELSYLRAIGVIILSAVLKRRMILADKAKSLFISNISHELRTPLHGILASAELLSETSLNHSQASFLQTVQACGTSLVETVNHVLDFTKLSGNAKAGGVENVIHLSRVNLMQLVEEATEGCWIGHRARMFTSEIGSVYSPPKSDRQSSVAVPLASNKHVETVIDVGHSEAGWTFRCEKGGIRRILMNVFGNSLKFTSDGYVHVQLRRLPPTSDTPRGKVRLELAVIDTGKGISQHFLKNQLFHPFSQENPLQTGTGLGLAIVNSIVRSPSVDGKVDVWSAEGVGTEIKVTFNAEAVDSPSEPTSFASELAKVLEHGQRPTISLLAFDESIRGVQLLRKVLKQYIESDWGFTLTDDDSAGDIVIVNEDPTPVTAAIEAKDAARPFIILSSARGDPRLMAIVNEYEHIGGFCRIVYKPVGPCRLVSALKLSLHALNIGQAPRPTPSLHQPAHRPESPSRSSSFDLPEGGHFAGKYSEEATGDSTSAFLQRPPLGPRAVTAHPLASWAHMPSTAEQDESELESAPNSPQMSPIPSSSTISVGMGGTLLKSSVNTVIEPNGPPRVLVVEDNSILRNLLVKWLRNMGYEYREAVDGLEGVRTFENEGHFDVVLLDLSMPILDGVGATLQMRAIESRRLKEQEEGKEGTNVQPSRILALTGMSSLEDKRRAFEAGVDG